MTPEQLARANAAPEGARLKLDGIWRTKVGRKLIPDEGPPPELGRVPIAEQRFEPASAVGRGLLAAGQNIALAGPLAAAMALQTPGRVAGEIGQLRRGEIGARNLFENAKKFAASMVPETLRQTFGALKARDLKQLPSLETAVEETATIAGVGVLGKRIPTALKKTAKATLGPRSAIPGVREGTTETLGGLAKGETAGLVRELRPIAGTVEREYAKLAALGNPRLAMTKLQDQIAKMVKNENLKPASLQDSGRLKFLDDLTKDVAEGLTFEQVRETIKTFGARVGSTADVPQGVARVTARRRRALLRATHEDVAQGNILDLAQVPIEVTRMRRVGGKKVPVKVTEMQTKATVTPPTAQTQALAQQFKVAQKVTRRDFAVTDLERIFQRATRKDGGIDLKAAIKRLDDASVAATQGARKAKLFVGAWEPGELHGIRTVLQRIDRDLIGKRPGAVERLVGHGISSGLGAALGGTTGALAGMTAPVVITQLLTTKAGRSLVVKLAKMDPTLTSPTTQTAIAGLLYAQTRAEQGAEP